MLVLITPPVTVPNEIALVRKMMKRGLGTLHIRKDWTHEWQCTEYLSSLRDCSSCVLHTFHHAAPPWKLKGIHYKEIDRPDGIIRAPSGVRTVSTSFHQLSQLGTCMGDLDYVFLSRLYPSISKQTMSSELLLGNDDLQHYLATSRYPVIALGGVVPEKFKELKELGFSGAALLGSVWNADNPLAAMDKSLDEAAKIGWSGDSLHSQDLSCSTV